MTPLRRVRARTALAVVLGLVAAVLAIVVSSLRPSVAAVFVTVTAAVALASAAAAGWRRLTRRARRRAAAIAALGLAVGLIAVLRLGDEGNFYAGAPPLVTVTVPYAATARLTSSGWEVQESIRIDDQAVEELQAATGVPAAEAAQLQGHLPIDPAWQLGRLVDGTAVYVRQVVVPVQEEPIGLTRVALDVPQMTVMGVQLVPRSESSAALLAPRAAVAATTPPADGEDATADEGGIVRTTVPVDDTTDEVTVALLGTWLRSPVGEKLYDFSTWSLLPYAVGALALTLSAWLRRRIVARLGVRSERPRKRTAGPDHGDQSRSAPDGTPSTPGRRTRAPAVAGLRGRRRSDR